MNPKANWIILVNPHAGGGRHQKKIHLLFKRLQVSDTGFEWLEAASLEAFQKLAIKAWQKGARHFAVVGGDGTVNTLINTLLKLPGFELSDCFFTVYPLGTGNDWAAYYGINKDREAFIKRLECGDEQWQDVGQVSYQNDGQESHHYFVNIFGSGFDTFVLDTMGSASGKPWRYFLTVLRCLSRYQSPLFSLVVNNNDYQMEAMMLMACLGRQGGAGMMFAPMADINDGQFNLVCIEEMPLSKKLLSLPYLFNGKVNSHPRVKIWLCNSFSLQADTNKKTDVNKKVNFQCDGEIVSALPASVDILAGIMRVVV